MDNKKSTFQLVLTIVFGSALFLGVLAFSGLLPGFSATRRSDNDVVNYGKVVVWGFYPSADVATTLRESFEKDDTISFRYVQKDPQLMEKDLLEEWARGGTGPDILLIPHDEMIKYEKDIALYPYLSYSQMQYNYDFIEEGEVFLRKDGIVALPVLVDPVVMYWNRTIFSSERVARVPETWEELTQLIPKLTKRTENGSIIRSAIAFGEYDNVVNAKAILSSLFLQAGNDIVNRTDSDKLESMFSEYNEYGSEAAVSTLDFYLSFSNPSNKVNYTWDRSLPNSMDSFLSGDLAIYIGMASDLVEIQKKNPHLNFDVARIPQIKENIGMREVTYGSLVGAYVMNKSKNIAGAYKGAQVLSGTKFVKALSDRMKIPPARRDVLANDLKNDANISVFYEAALMSRGWIDPDTYETDMAFRDMIIDINSGRKTTVSAVRLVGTLLKNMITDK